MNLRYLLAGILVLAAVIIAGSQLNQLTGYYVSKGDAINVLVNIRNGTNNRTYSIEIYGNQTALEALQKIAEIKYETYDMGAFITSINGLEQTNDHYWLYFVNDKLANVSADRYYLKDMDRITFVYSSVEDAENLFK